MTLRITEPTISSTAAEWVPVSGIGAGPGQIVVVVNHLVPQFAYLQPDIVTADQRGIWRNARSRLVALNWERKLYAVALPPEFEDAIRTLPSVVFPNIAWLTGKLDGLGIPYTISEGKLLVRFPV